MPWQCGKKAKQAETLGWVGFQGTVSQVRIIPILLRPSFASDGTNEELWPLAYIHIALLTL